MRKDHASSLKYLSLESGTILLTHVGNARVVVLPPGGSLGFNRKAVLMAANVEEETILGLPILIYIIRTYKRFFSGERPGWCHSGRKHRG